MNNNLLLYQRGKSGKNMSNNGKITDFTSREPIDMDNSVHNTGEKNNKEKEDNPKKDILFWIKAISHNPLVSAVLAALIVAALQNYFSYHRSVIKMQEDIESINDSISGLTTTLDKTNTNISDMATEYSGMTERISSIENDIEEMKDDIKTLDDRIYGIVYNPSDTARESIASISYNEEKANVVASPLCTDEDILAYDSEGNAYTAAELVGKTVLMAYTEDGQEVYFLGQYNEKYHWNGCCTINVFKNNKLVIMTDAEYEDGTLLNYKQIIPDKDSDGSDIWRVSDRICDGDINYGFSWMYKSTENYTKSFTMDNVTKNDIQSASAFEEKINDVLIGYYKGNTSDGYYNDDTGEAYYIRFYPDGTVKSLYVGKFKNGQFDDHTGNAWNIAKNDDSEYEYFKGIFDNGIKDRDKDTCEIIYPISQDQIQEIISNYSFDYDLKWAGNE